MSDETIKDATEEFELARMRAQFARLLKLSEQAEADLKLNPGKYISQAYHRLSKLKIAIEEAYYALHSRVSFTPDYNPEYDCSVSRESRLMTRIEDARRILKEAMSND